MAETKKEEEVSTPTKEKEERNNSEEIYTNENTPQDLTPGQTASRERKQHKLNERWVFWYLSRVRTEKNNSLPFSERLKVLGEVNSVEEFFQYYCYFKRPAEMPKEIDFHFFRKGEVPMWEVIYIVYILAFS